MKYYLAGPMSGIPQFNFPAFDAAAAALRSGGLEIVSPAELDDPVAREAALASLDGRPILGSVGPSWGDFLARDVKLITDGGIGGLIFLPDWWKSRGASLEATVGLLSGLDFFAYEYRLPRLSPRHVLLDIRRGFEHRRQL